MSSKETRLLRSAVFTAMCCTIVSVSLLISFFAIRSLSSHEKAEDVSSDVILLYDPTHYSGKNNSPIAIPLVANLSPELTMSYSIVVDGIAVCASNDKDVLVNSLSTILSQYVESDTVSISFKEIVSIQHIPVSETLFFTESEICSLLSPGTGSNRSLTVIAEKVTSETVPIPYSTKYVYDSGKYSDESEIIRSGSDGICVNKYTSTYENGVFVGTVMSSTSILSTPINELVSIGTIEGSRCDSKGYYIFPTDGTISSYFGYRVSTIGSANHKGVDIAASKGTAVLAADGGEVIFTGWVSGYGNLIKLRHDNGDVTYYGHLSKILVSDGDSIAQGDKIAEVGSTGISTGPHLHFELRINNTPVDPLDYLEF